MLIEADRQVARILPPSLRNFYTRTMRRLAEYGLPRGTNVRETDFGFTMDVDRLDAIKWFIHYFGCFEPVITKAWLTILKPGDLVIDIGGNVGYHALLAASAVGPTGRVHTFEASSKIFSQLSRNIDRNGFHQITAHHRAVSNEAGSVTLFYGGDNAQGDSSIMHSHEGARGEQVPAISFDEIARMCPLGDAGIIKIDVEGAEALVVSGLAHHLCELDDSCAVFLEISRENRQISSEIIAPFIENDFKVKAIENSYKTEYFDQHKPIVLRDPHDAPEGVLDLILTRDETIFSRLSQA